MSLDALAPDQRAVVQLVLQQGRSYADLAGMLGIAEDAVRERAHRGLATLAPAEGLDPDEQGEVADWLLGQGSASAREATKSLLRTDAGVNAWATAVAAELADLRGARVPEVPEPARRRRAATTPPEAELPEDAPGAADIAPPEDLGTAASGITTDQPDEAPAVRARPRPKRADPPAATPSLADEDDSTVTAPAPRSSKLGGALLIGVVAIAVVALVVFLVTRGDDSDDTESASTGTTPTASATPQASATPFKNGDELLVAINTLAMDPLPGSNAEGAISFFLDQQNEDRNKQTLTFQLQATGMDPDGAYAIWLIGGGAPYRVGYASNVEGERTKVIEDDGSLRIRGPQASKGSSKAARQSRRDAQAFTRRLQTAQQIVLAQATDPAAKQPGAIVLSTDLSPQDGAATATPTTTP